MLGKLDFVFYVLLKCSLKYLLMNNRLPMVFHNRYIIPAGDLPMQESRISEARSFPSMFLSVISYWLKNKGIQWRSIYLKTSTFNKTIEQVCVWCVCMCVYVCVWVGGWEMGGDFKPLLKSDHLSLFFHWRSRFLAFPDILLKRITSNLVDTFNVVFSRPH